MWYFRSSRKVLETKQTSVAIAHRGYWFLLFCFVIVVISELQHEYRETRTICKGVGEGILGQHQLHIPEYSVTKFHWLNWKVCRTDSKFTNCISLGSVLTTFLKIKRISSWPLVSNHRLEFLNGETFVNQLLKRPTTFKSSGDYFSKSNSLL